MASTRLPGYLSESDTLEEGTFEQELPGSPSSPRSARVFTLLRFKLKDGTIVDRFPVEEGPSLRNAQVYVVLPTTGGPRNCQGEQFRLPRDPAKPANGTARETLPLPVAPVFDASWSLLSLTFDHLADDMDIGYGIWHDGTAPLRAVTRIAKDYSPDAYHAGRLRPAGK